MHPAGEPPPSAQRSDAGPLPVRPRWHRVGYALTLLWFVAVVLIARGDRDHPLQDVIFTAPLAGWILAMIVDRVLGRYRAAARRSGT